MEQIGEELMVRVMRYCDGTLTGEGASAVAAEIAADPKLQELAARLTQGASLARKALSGIAHDAIPLNLVRTIVQAGEGKNGAGVVGVAAPAPFNRRRGLLFAFPREVAAAFIGLVLGGAAIGLWSLSGSDDDGLRLASAPDSAATEGFSAPLKAALVDVLREPGTLRTQRYTLDQTAGNEAEISVVAWFKLSDGSQCAELRHVDPQAGVAAGVACQDASAAWEILLHGFAE